MASRQRTEVFELAPLHLASIGFKVDIMETTDEFKRLLNVELMALRTNLRVNSFLNLICVL